MQLCITDIIPPAFLFFNAESLIRNGGLLMVMLIVFCSTGLIICFFLPVGAVLFTAGVFAATGDLHQGIFSICSLLVLASVLGNLTGYGLGLRTGPLIYKRKDSRFFRQQYLVAANNFYKKYGWLALTFGLYLPVIRTFAPFVAGVIRMNFRRFILFSALGSVIFVLSFVLAGYFIGNIPFLKTSIRYIVAGFILVITVPIVIKIIKRMKHAKKE